MSQKKLMLIAGLAISMAACTSKQKENNNTIGSGDTNIIQNPTPVQQDSMVLSDDSATIKTVKDVKLEEKSAIKQDKKEESKMKADEKKAE